MEKISFEVYTSDATIKPDNYNRIRVEVDGVEISDLLESIEDNPSILESIGEKNIATWINDNNGLSEFLDNFSGLEIAEYLEAKGWKIGGEDD